MRRTGVSLFISGFETYATLTCSTEKALLCQVKGKEKAGASPARRSRRNQKWTYSAPPQCSTSTISPTTWPTACTCAASAGQALPSPRRGKTRPKPERLPAPLYCREQHLGKRRQNNTSVASKIDSPEDNLRCKLNALFCGS